MRRTRLIPVLLMHNGGLYKTIKFKNPVYIGDPINTMRLFNEMEVDEIIILNINSSKENRDPDYMFLEEIASEAFMPVAYGGGIRTVDQASRVLKCGIEKVVINHAAQTTGTIISECACRFGSQSVVSSIDYTKKLLVGRKQYDHVTGSSLRLTPIEAAINAQNYGAGEVILNCVDRDGCMQGLDTELIQEAAQHLHVPIVACGGAGSLEHIRHAETAGASAIAGGSMFVFRGSQRGILISYPCESQLSQYLR